MKRKANHAYCNLALLEVGFSVLPSDFAITAKGVCLFPILIAMFCHQRYHNGGG